MPKSGWVGGVRSLVENSTNVFFLPLPFVNNLLKDFVNLFNFGPLCGGGGSAFFKKNLKLKKNPNHLLGGGLN